MNHEPVRLFPLDRPLAIAHLCALAMHDRQLRFGAGVSDEGIVRYVERIDFGTDALFAVRGNDRALLGLVHVGWSRPTAEIGVSVLDTVRRRGIGLALMRRAMGWAREHGAQSVWMLCGQANSGIVQLALRCGMQLSSDGDECIAQRRLCVNADVDARPLPPPPRAQCGFLPLFIRQSGRIRGSKPPPAPEDTP